MAMKLMVLVLFVVAVAAEPPRYRSSFAQAQSVETPYAAAGRPSGQRFQLPQRQVLPSYGPPPADLTTPEPTTTEATTLEPTSDKTNATKSDKKDKANLEESDEVEEIEPKGQAPQQPVYYILLPTGQLQQVQYLTPNGQANLPQAIRQPVYAFDADQQLYQLIF